jgi:UDP-N-acetylmuramoyl-tripeptide--D-alanyl-D-alanine ligase
MGMYTMGEIATMCEIARPDIGVVTMIDAVHMERAGSLENIVLAKQELVEALPAEGVAILNRDEPLVMSMAAHTQARVVTYGLDAGADLWASDIESMGLNGIRFILHSGREALHLQVPLLGRHSVHTVLGAAAVGRVEGMEWEEIIAGLQSGQAQLRIVTATGPEGALILDDTYNASPASMIAALNLLEDFAGRRIAVLGDMLELGDAEEASHRLVGRRAALVANILITVGRLGRIIGEEALAAGMAKENVRITNSMEQAASILQEIVIGGDTILVKGSRAVRLDELVSVISQPEEPERVR